MATAAVGTRDIVQEGVTGLLTPVGEPEVAAKAIARLLLDGTTSSGDGSSRQGTGSPPLLARGHGKDGLDSYTWI